MPETIGPNEPGLDESAIASQFPSEVVTRALVRDVELPYGAGTMALITLDNGYDHTRPNTFGPAGLISLRDALDSVADRDDIAAVGVTGKPFIFAAGADPLGEILGVLLPVLDSTVPGVGGRVVADALIGAFAEHYRCEQPGDADVLERIAHPVGGDPLKNLVTAGAVIEAALPACPGGVTGVVAAGSGDVLVPGLFEDADGEVAKVAMTYGPLPVRVWEASSP